MKTVNLGDKVAWLGGLDGRPSPLGYRLRYMACAMLGHSRISTSFFGYIYCARCHEQVGDSLGGADTAFVDFRHLREGSCNTCEGRRGQLVWRDKWLTWDYKDYDRELLTPAKGEE